jgi:hypothetical protein
MIQADPPLSVRYLCNPDVVLREEDPDGGLLFNPDTNQIRVLNHTGLFVWKLCDGGHDLGAILAEINETYDGVPEDQVTEQIKTYVEEMVCSGFIGIVEDQAT